MIARRRFPNGYVARAFRAYTDRHGIVGLIPPIRLGLCMGVVKRDEPDWCRACGGMRVKPYPCWDCGPDGREAYH